MTEPLLAVRGVKTFYGNIMALKGVDLDVHDGEIVALIGANGAGKSTLMMTIFGNPRAREGRIVFAGRDITDLPTHEIAHLRIAQAPEGRRIFARMRMPRWTTSTRWNPGPRSYSSPGSSGAVRPGSRAGPLPALGGRPGTSWATWRSWVRRSASFISRCSTRSSSRHCHIWPILST